jgi:hypothetical protein
MKTKLRKAAILSAGVIFVGVETIHLAHYDIDVPKQAHTEHEYYFAPETSSFTLAAGGGSRNISITPLTGSIEINRPLIT